MTCSALKCQRDIPPSLLWCRAPDCWSDSLSSLLCHLGPTVRLPFSTLSLTTANNNNYNNNNRMLMFDRAELDVSERLQASLNSAVVANPTPAVQLNNFMPTEPTMPSAAEPNPPASFASLSPPTAQPRHQRLHGASPAHVRSSSARPSNANLDPIYIFIYIYQEFR